LSEPDQRKNGKELEKPCLVLNKQWKPIHVITVKDAIVLIMKGNANAIGLDDFAPYTWEKWFDTENPPKCNNTIPSTSGDVPAPEIIVLTNYEGYYRRIERYSNLAVFRRDSFTCQYCGNALDRRQSSIDHVIPRSHIDEKTGKSRGITSFLNCVCACKTCNVKKANRTPAESGMPLLRQPTAPTYNAISSVRPENRPESWKNFL